MTVPSFLTMTTPFWQKLAKKPSGSNFSATSFASAGKSWESLNTTWIFPHVWARRCNEVSIVDQPGTSTNIMSVVACVVSWMSLNVTWDNFEDVSVDIRSSLIGVGDQNEVKVSSISWREVHELRSKGVEQLLLPPTKVKKVR